jgi:hypothetical protein
LQRRAKKLMASIGQLVGRSAVGLSFGQRQADRVLNLSAAGIASANRAGISRCESQETEHAELRRHARSGIQTPVNAGDHLLRSAGDD